MRLFFCRKTFIKGTVNVALLGVDFPTFGIPRLTDREGKKLPCGFHFIAGCLQLGTYGRNLVVAVSHLADFEAISASRRAFHSARFSGLVLAQPEGLSIMSTARSSMVFVRAASSSH